MLRAKKKARVNLPAHPLYGGGGSFRAVKKSRFSKGGAFDGGINKIAYSSVADQQSVEEESVIDPSVEDKGLTPEEIKALKKQKTLAGAGKGAKIGASVGSIIPGVGTLVGGAVGGLIGGFAANKKFDPNEGLEDPNAINAKFGGRVRAIKKFAPGGVVEGDPYKKPSNVPDLLNALRDYDKDSQSGYIQDKRWDPRHSAIEPSDMAVRSGDAFRDSPVQTVNLPDVFVMSEGDSTMKERFPGASDEYDLSVEAAMNKESGGKREKEEGGNYKTVNRVNEVFPRLKNTQNSKSPGLFKELVAKAVEQSQIDSPVDKLDEEAIKAQYEKSLAKELKKLEKMAPSELESLGFDKYWKDKKIRNELVKNPEALFNAVYGGEWGSKKFNNTEEGDGYKYRGRGLVQLTGKSNYAAASKALYGDDRLVTDPYLVTTPEYAEQVATWFLKNNRNRTLDRLVEKHGYDIDPEDMTQEDNNLLVASQLSGGKNPRSYPVGRQGLRKMNRYLKAQPNESNKEPQP